MYKGGSMEILFVDIVTAVGIYQNIPLNLQVIHPRFVPCIQVRSKDLQVKTQLVLWIFILFKVTR